MIIHRRTSYGSCWQDNYVETLEIDDIKFMVINFKNGQVVGQFIFNNFKTADSFHDDMISKIAKELGMKDPQLHTIVDSPVLIDWDTERLFKCMYDEDNPPFDACIE